MESEVNSLFTLSFSVTNDQTITELKEENCKSIVDNKEIYHVESDTSNNSSQELEPKDKLISFNSGFLGSYFDGTEVSDKCLSTDVVFENSTDFVDENCDTTTSSLQQEMPWDYKISSFPSLPSLPFLNSVKSLQNDNAYKHEEDNFTNLFFSSEEDELVKLISNPKSDDELILYFEKTTTIFLFKNLMLKHFYDFCKAISSSNRNRIAKQFDEFMTTNEANTYRFKAEFVDQLIKVIALFNAIEVNRYFSGFALLFSGDKIASVRDKGIELLAIVIGTLISHEWTQFKNENKFLIDDDMEFINLPITGNILHVVRKDFLLCKNWRRRQSYARLLNLLLSKELVSEKLFCHYFYEDMMCISEDCVPNVRQIFCHLAQSASSLQFFIAEEKFIADSIFKQLKKLLINDTDIEIRYLSGQILNKFDPNVSEA